MSITEEQLKELHAQYASQPFNIGDTRYYNTTSRTTRLTSRTYRYEHYRTCALCDQAAWLPNKRDFDDPTPRWTNDHGQPYFRGCFCPDHRDEGLAIRKHLETLLRNTAEQFLEEAIANARHRLSQTDTQPHDPAP